MLFTEEDSGKQTDEDLNEKVPNENKYVSGIWTLEFDGSCASSGSGANMKL